MKSSFEMELRNSHGANTESNDAKPISKYRIFKNLVIVSVGSMIILGTDDIILTLQSTLNSEGGMGVLSAAVQAFLGGMTALLAPKYLIYKIGSKAVMILSIFAFLPFFASNYNPMWVTMISTSVILGMGYALIWSSICTYLNDLSGLYDEYCTAKENEEMFSETLKENYTPKYNDLPLTYNCQQLNEQTKTSVYTVSNDFTSRNKTEPNCIAAESKLTKYILPSKRENKIDEKEPTTSQLDSITSRVFAFHSLIYKTGFVFSSLMPYFIFKNDSKPELNVSSFNCSCGAGYCNTDTDCSETNLEQPSKLTRDIMISACIVLAFGGAVLIFIFLEKLTSKETNASSKNFLLATLKQTRKKAHLLLIPLTIYPGLLKGFYIGDYTKSYIGCAWGIENIGLVNACSSVSMVVSSTLSGWLVKHTGRFKIFAIAAIGNYIFIAVLLSWQPDQNKQYMFFISSVLFGTLHGIYFTQLMAYYGVLFKEDEEAAFGAFNLWNQTGIFLSLVFSNYLCNYIKIYSLVICFTLGILGYVIVEKYDFSNNN